MSILVNDRDVLLQSVASRVDITGVSRALILSAPTNVFHVNSDNTGTPVSIILTANLINIAGTLVFSRSDNVAAPTSGNTTTISFSSLTGFDVTVSATVVSLGITYTATQFFSKITDGSAAITNEQTIRQNADDALAQNISSVNTRVDGNVSSIITANTSRSNGDSALATRIDNLSVIVGNNSGSITTEATTRANNDNALAQTTTNLSTTVNGHTSSISTQQTSIDGLNASYSVRINNNGNVVGYGLSSGAGGTSSFIINALNFTIVNPNDLNNGKFYWSGATNSLVIEGDIYARNFYGNVVNTGNVVAGAITSRSSYYDATEQTIPANGNWYAWASLGITTSGSAVSLVFSTSVRIGVTYSNDAGLAYTDSSAAFRIRRGDGAIVYESPPLGRGPFCATVSTDVGAGYHEYFAEVTAMGEVYIANRSMFGLETKR